MNWLSTKDYIADMQSYHDCWSNETGHENHISFLNISIFKKWCEENNIKKWLYESNNWTYLICNLARWNPNVKVPSQDHKLIFRNDKNENILIIQPYLNNYNFDEIVKWSNQRGIKVSEFKTHSWHCPNRTTLIEFKVIDKLLFKKSVKDIKDLSR